MEFLIFMVLLYFLPTILASVLVENPVGIFLVNFFLGWTVIGWWVALVWAVASHKTLQVRQVPASSGRFCSCCGKLSAYGARFCSGCGRAV
jgi:Superinfection immunity protein